MRYEYIEINWYKIWTFDFLSEGFLNVDNDSPGSWTCLMRLILITIFIWNNSKGKNNLRPLMKVATFWLYVNLSRLINLCFSNVKWNYYLNCSFRLKSLWRYLNGTHPAVAASGLPYSVCT